MVIDSFVIQGIINKNILSLEYEIQQILEHQILVEASASRTKAQQESLKDLFDKARAYLTVDGSAINVDLTFLSVPKGMEEYAELLKLNSSTMIQTILESKVEDILSLEDSQEAIRNYVKEWAIMEIQNVIGGVS